MYTIRSVSVLCAISIACDGKLHFPDGDSLDCPHLGKLATGCGADYLCDTKQAEDNLRIFVINLLARTDRWQQVLSTWSYMPNVQRGLKRFPALPHAPVGDKLLNGCAASHVAAVETFFSTCLSENILMVLEDDAVPRPDFDARFPAVLEYARTHLDEWHIINLGSTRGVPSTHPDDKDNRTAIYQLRSPHLLRVSVWSGAHALLVNRRALPAYSRLRAIYQQHDLSSPWAHNDYVLSHDEDLVTLVAVPSLVWQSVGYSDIRLGGMDYSNLMREADQDLLAARDALQRLGWPAILVPRNGSNPHGQPYFDWLEPESGLHGRAVHV